MIVPEPKEIKVLLGFASMEGPSADELLESLEEALDTPVLPRCEGGRALMPDAEETESEPEERGGEDGLVVGTDASWLAEAFDCVQDGADNRDRSLGSNVAEGQTGAGIVIEQPENGALSSALADVGEVEGPDDVWRHSPWPPVLQLAADRDQVMLALSEHVGDEGLAGGHSSSMSVQVIEDDRDLSASVVRHQGLEAQDFLVDPWRFGQIATAACGRYQHLGSAPSRCRPMSSGVTQKDE